MKRVNLALVQMTSSEDVGENIAHACAFIDEAAGKGAQLIATPEMTSLLTSKRETLFAQAAEEAEDKALAAFQKKAEERQVWLLIGSLPIVVGEGRVANRSFLISPDGGVRARYDKIHMFDVDLDGGESYRESKLYQAGETAVVADTPWGGLGLSVCYDVRFPYLYRALAQNGAQMLSVPAAFTRPTGEAHWHVLLRARAIETGCFVFAPAQTGVHAGGRKTYGHSLIVDPWGEILADGDDKCGIVQAELDLSHVEKARKRIPSLHHDRPVKSVKRL